MWGIAIQIVRRGGSLLEIHFPMGITNVCVCLSSQMGN
ncbi:hypothetical protein LEP1GSC202_1281 [Leptospira yanagawae serovar Saopaulo str. Sao Paulo = ATCC 700523]|uniref:Uncharacterized protein n=1 Tax=Leptospira yanagawae serovar Saopaulo str. Sao Paulo = ATCC 700523 TaxID=1249483 RepID=A0A5E8HEV4_9LEPT|nr:hypothetical protein LEP1GSC202_1281 [Leptospira yanagawae serovar Saopaulo str. Sao Paulo = ATCC 700523]